MEVVIKVRHFKFHLIEVLMDLKCSLHKEWDAVCSRVSGFCLGFLCTEIRVF